MRRRHKGRPQRNLPFDSNVSQREGFIADVYRAVRARFLLFARSVSPDVLSFLSRRTEDFLSPLRSNKNNVASDEPSHRWEGNDG